MTKRYYAHSGARKDRSDWQTLEEHHEACGQLAEARGAPLGLGSAAGLAARFHDFGKYAPDFDRRLRGEDIRIDHSTAGAHLLLARVPQRMRPCAEALAHGSVGRNGS